MRYFSWRLNFVLTDLNNCGFSPLAELQRKGFAEDDIFCCTTWNRGLGSKRVGGCRTPVMRGGEPEGASGAIPDDPAFRAYGGGFRVDLFTKAWSGARRRTYCSDAVWGNRVTDLLRWGSELFPENRSFRGVAKSSLNLSRSAFDFVRAGALAAARTPSAVALPRPWPSGVCAATVLVFGASTYSAVGYLHYKHVAGTERVAAQRAERANADLQDAL